MSISKKLLTSAVAVFLLSGASAYANELNVDLNIGGGGGYVAPAPVYVAPQPVYMAPTPVYYDPRHRHGDYRYWHEHHEHDPHWHR